MTAALSRETRHEHHTTPRTDELRRAYSDSLHDGIGEFMAELFASHEALEREAHRQSLEQEPVGWLDWPSLTFRLNGLVSVRAPTSVVVQPIPLYAKAQPAPGMVMVPIEPTEAMPDGETMLAGPDAPLDCGCSQTWCKHWNERDQWCPRRNAAGERSTGVGAAPLTAPESPAAPLSLAELVAQYDVQCATTQELAPTRALSDALRQSSDYPNQPMCPNCISPWKCNGPHMTTPSKTPVTDAASNGPLPNALGTHADETVPAHVARRIENALTELLAVIHRDGGQYLAEHGLEKAAKDAMEKVSESRAECERLRSDIERHVRLSAEVVNTNERLRKR